jgi:hypothetical protein
MRPRPGVTSGCVDVRCGRSGPRAGYGYGATYEPNRTQCALPVRERAQAQALLPAARHRCCARRARGRARLGPDAALGRIASRRATRHRLGRRHETAADHRSTRACGGCRTRAGSTIPTSAWPGSARARPPAGPSIARRSSASCAASSITTRGSATTAARCCAIALAPGVYRVGTFGRARNASPGRPNGGAAAKPDLFLQETLRSGHPSRSDSRV